MTSPDVDLLSLRLAIGIPTRRRPEALKRAVNSLADQDRIGTEPITLIIVDNDENESARAIAGELSDEYAGKLKVRYIVESSEGYSSVRNRLLLEALEAGVDILWMMDDDEVADNNWTRAGIACSEAYDCDIVAGPCDYVREYSHHPGSATVSTRSWTSPSTTRRLATGTRLSVASAHNLMLRLDRLRNRPIKFSESYNRSGGEDTEWSMRLARQGTRIVWCEEARVTEFVPPYRTEITWLRKRALRNGVNLYIARSDVQGHRPIALVLKAAVGVVALTPPAVVKALLHRRHRDWWSVEGRALRHAGVLFAFLGDLFHRQIDSMEYGLTPSTHRLRGPRVAPPAMGNMDAG